MKKLILLLAALCFGQAFAWHDTGHMIVAGIAYPRLNKFAKAEVARLAKMRLENEKEQYDFLSAPAWPDDIRRFGRDRRFDKWHYVDNPLTFDGTQGPAPDKENIVWAIAQAKAALKNPKTPDMEKAKQLRFLLHFAGDIHVPLHSVSLYSKERPKGDRGGNSFRVMWKGKNSNLHFFWDTGAGLFRELTRPLTSSERAFVLNWSRRITAEYPASKLKEWTNAQVGDWAKEGISASRNFVYALKEKETPPAPYVARAREIAERRLALAGYRLAALLNSIYKK